jgi:hypothetical protein
MAVTWTPYADGVSLLTLRNAINTFNSAVQTNIGSIEANITDLGISKISIADKGLVFISGNGTPASLTTSYQKVKMFDTTSINEANGHIAVDNVLATYTINTTGIYKIVFSGAMTANNGAIVTFNYNINGGSALANPRQITGEGSKQTGLDSNAVFSLTAGAVIYIECKADASATMTPYSCGLMIEKLHY